MHCRSLTSSIAVQGNHQEEDDGIATDNDKSGTQAETAQEEAEMTVDALPELVQMMTDIQAALREPESSAGPENTTMEAGDVQGSLFALSQGGVCEMLKS